ncbi:MAG: 50S ribosomal protein L9 [Arsenophonus sp.]|nr:MAG: 50S ribosomal protein L9 [Arsenophonus sp.]
MKVILLKKIEKLGNIGEIAFVKSGYARNYLIPKEKALIATKENISFFKEKRNEIEKKEKKIFEDAQNRLKKIKNIKNIIIYAKSGLQGRLFGSIGKKDIIKEFYKKNILISKNEIYLKNGIFKNTGKYEIILKLHSEINYKFNIVILDKKEEEK